MNTIERIIHFGIGDVFDVQSKKLHYDHLMIREGCGRGTYENGFAPNFQDKMGQFDLLMEEKTLIELGNGEAKAMSPGSLKCRYDGHSFGEDIDPAYRHTSLQVRIGPTSWHEWRQDYNRSLEQAMALQNLGLKQYDDRGFYLSNGLGATVLTLSREGDVIVGVRKSDSYDGAIHGAAGWMTFDRNPANISPTKDAYRELGEELAIKQDQVSSLTLVGLVAYPKTRKADFVFIAKTDKERGYFTSGAWKEAVDAREHRELIVLSNPDEIHRLLQDGKPPADNRKFEVVPSTHYGLEVLAEYWDKLRPNQ